MNYFMLAILASVLRPALIILFNGIAILLVIWLLPVILKILFWEFF